MPEQLAALDPEKKVPYIPELRKNRAGSLQEAQSQIARRVYKNQKINKFARQSLIGREPSRIQKSQMAENPGGSMRFASDGKTFPLTAFSQIEKDYEMLVQNKEETMTAMSATADVRKEEEEIDTEDLETKE